MWGEFSFFVSISQMEACRYFLATSKIKGWEEKESERALEIRLWVSKEKRRWMREKIKPFALGKIRERTIREEIWGKTWKRFFKPISVGKKLCVLPSWEKLPRGSKRTAIKIHPGTAFGTGDHPTTRMCLAALEGMAGPGQKWLDFGTGSGILAIALARLGAAKILAIDEDPLAVDAAKKNAARNRAGEKILVRRMSAPPLTGKFDGIVSNILAEPLAELAPAFLRILKPGKELILSGIAADKRELVERAYRDSGSQVKLLQCEGDWVCLGIAKG